MGCSPSYKLSRGGEVKRPELPTFEGKVYIRGEEGYLEHAYQYASSTFDDGSMTPSFILYATGDEDIFKAIRYAKERKIAIAVRTGGHQFSGASSTSGANFQIDMSKAYLEFEPNVETGVVRAGISHMLKNFNHKLGAVGLFVPHGQCAHVHVGGHVQTGGGSPVTRAFGYFDDHVLSFEIITADGQKRLIRRDAVDPEEKEMYYCVLGGSPGNFGIMTHVTIQALKNSDHPNSRAHKLTCFYDRARHERLLALQMEMYAQPNLPADYDVIVIQFSANELVLPHARPNLDQWMRQQHAALQGDIGLPINPAVIMVYFSWANLGGAAQQYDPYWANRFIEAAGLSFNLAAFGVASLDHTVHTPMSSALDGFLFPNPRESDNPAFKGFLQSDIDAKELIQRGFPQWMADRGAEIERDLFDGCLITIQTHYCEGTNSRSTAFAQKNSNSIQWRTTSTLAVIFDVFYDPKPGPKETARKWHERMLSEGIGPQGKLSKGDRRPIAFTFGDRNMGNVWQLYFESEDKYRRVCALKERIDPTGLFTPNQMCVGMKPSAVVPGKEDPGRWDDKQMVPKVLARKEAL